LWYLWKYVVSLVSVVSMVTVESDTMIPQLPVSTAVEKRNSSGSWTYMIFYMPYIKH
jgi:hypothetical protein